MIVVLTREQTLSDIDRTIEIELPSGFEFTRISFHNLPERIRDNMLHNHRKSLENNKSFAFYLKGHWFIVNADTCEVPSSVGWLYNKL